MPVAKSPIDLKSLELLARTGWSWERMLRTTVQYVNQVDNATSAGGPMPKRKPDHKEFRYHAQLMRQLQSERAIELSTSEREGTPKFVPLSREQLDGDFVIGAIEDGYKFRETSDGLFLVKDEKFLALNIHPKYQTFGRVTGIGRTPASRS